MFADDFAAHKTDNVRRLCWERGYVLIIHAGGATPVVQTCDTDLNQHVRREYGALETQEFIEHFQRGECVPKLEPETMIDIMVDVLSRKALHIAAAAGYKKTAVAVKLEGGEDEQIAREALEFWEDLGMRKKVNKEVTRVRAEAGAGRLTWSYRDVESLIMPYPRKKEEDEILRKSRDAKFFDDEETAWRDAFHQTAFCGLARSN